MRTQILSACYALPDVLIRISTPYTFEVNNNICLRTSGSGS